MIHSHLLEILPDGFNSYEEYCDQLNEFLKHHEFLIVGNHYNEQNELTYIDRNVHALLFDQYHNLPLDWIESFFDPLEHYLHNNPSHANEVYCYIMDLVSDHMPTKAYPEGVDVNLIKELQKTFPLPQSLQRMIEKSRELLPNIAHDVKEQITNEKWFHKDTKGKSQPICVKLMNQKKKYEIQLLGDLVIDYSDKLHINTVVDVGSGKGYLTQYIKFNSSIRAVGIEGNADNTTKMEERTTKLTTKFKNVNIPSTEGYTAFLTSSTLPTDFQQIAKLQPNENVMLTGLHPCGDLTPTLMRFFKSIPQIKSIVFVGCCYHKLTENPSFFSNTHQHDNSTILNNSNSYGFPMSKYLLNDNKVLFHLSQSYISASPHPDSKTREEWLYAMKMHSYRTALELLIHEHLPDYSETHYTGKIRNEFSKSFGMYAKRALMNIKSHAKTFNFDNPNYPHVLCSWIDDFFK
ncbi:Methyltransferase domain-containing protein [Entamoeba marina]